MMRVVVVNHAHPATPHVSGMRAWHFARALSARGHQVVLICEGRADAPFAPEAPDLAGVIEGHDWTRPLILAVKPKPQAVLTRVRAKETARLVRKGLVAWSYARHSGVFADFRRGAEPLLGPLAERFAPDVVWAVFGNTDCWAIAQRLAAAARCGWVGDMKDAWDPWIPPGLRTLLARRFGDMAAATANARFHADAVERWFPVTPAVVYSGVDPDWIESPDAPIDGFRVTMIGGVYDDANLARYVRAFGNWLETLTPADRDRVSFCYAGSDHARVAAAMAPLTPTVRVEVQAYRPLPELAALCRSSAVNVYLWSPTTFHHKLVELLCCRRPIISFPGEHEESRELARRMGGSLTVCRDEEDLRQAFQAIWPGGQPPAGVPALLAGLTWDAQAHRLAGVLQRVAETRRA